MQAVDPKYNFTSLKNQYRGPSNSCLNGREKSSIHSVRNDTVEPLDLQGSPFPVRAVHGGRETIEGFVLTNVVLNFLLLKFRK